MIAQILFIIILGAAVYLFSKNAGKIRRNILLGKDTDRSDNPALRWKTMAKIALGQTKMVKRPLAAVMHFFIYVGFIIINLEVLEIVLDGILGTHRLFAPPLGQLYNWLINGLKESNHSWVSLKMKLEVLDREKAKPVRKLQLL